MTKTENEMDGVEYASRVWKGIRVKQGVVFGRLGLFDRIRRWLRRLLLEIHDRI